jgi:hypothetical protein
MHRKVSAVRGLMWLAQAWRLVLSMPRPLIPMVMWLSVAMMMPVLSVLVLLMICVFYGGILTAIHKKTAFRQDAGMLDMFNGFKSSSHFLGLWTLSLPSVLFAFLLTFAFISAIGPEMAEQMMKGVRPDQKAAEALFPAIAQTFLKLLPLGILIFWFIFIAVPRVMFDNRSGFAALWDAANVIFSNFFALLLFTVAYGLAMFLTSLFFAIPVSLLAVMGPIGGIAQILLFVFVSSLSLLLYLTAMYCAWRDIYATEEPDQKTDVTTEAPKAKSSSAQIEV